MESFELIQLSANRKQQNLWWISVRKWL